jgi:hypothetical protein
MMRSVVVCGVALILGAAAVGETGSPQASEGFVSLFNGKDLTGWTVNKGGNIKKWGVEGGVLYVSGSGGGWLMTEKEYGDFDLRLEYKMAKHGNSGVGLRSPLAGDPAYVGMEIQLIDDANWPGLKAWQHTGSIYGVVPAAKIANRPLGEWNKMHIVARGPHIFVGLNGSKLVDADLRKYVKRYAQTHPGLLRKTGHIGLQSHDQRVEFRNLQLKPL